MSRILLIEDDPAISLSLADSLREARYEVVTAASGERGYALARRGTAALIILDLTLPGKSGEEICRDLRAAGARTPILVLTSKAEEADKVVGLELGADDYVTKPFSVRELHARVRALLRRPAAPAAEPEEYSFGDVRLDLKRMSATRAGKPLELSAREFEVLRFMVRREGEVVTRDMLLECVWGYEFIPTTRTVDNYILALRKKIERRPSVPVHLVTVHTKGYRFVRSAG